MQAVHSEGQAVLRIVIRKPGGYSALETVEEPDPTPGPGEVMIAVEAAGVNYADGIIRMGLYEKALPYPVRTWLKSALDSRSATGRN
jgi:NADPH:quinone reductase-like Zn-dependent oxidoreductase